MAITSCRTSYIKSKCLTKKLDKTCASFLWEKKWDLRFCPTCSVEHCRPQAQLCGDVGGEGGIKY